MTSISVRAPAKINLFLHVGERRLDGFHDLQSLVLFTEACDRLHFTLDETLTLQTLGPFAEALPKNDNLVLRAARAVGNGRAARITLEKNLPVAAGIGGGSADAAATLRGLNVLWNLGRSDADLAEIASAIGSDVPACIYSQPVWMEGRGERVTVLKALPPIAVVLVNPRVPVPTPAVFAALNMRSGVDLMVPPAADIRDVWDLVSYLADAGNDLEPPASTMFPIIDQALGALEHEPGCVHAQMSGSGATCFGLFQDGPWAEGAAMRLAADHPDWWVVATRFASSDIGEPLITAGEKYQ